MMASISLLAISFGSNPYSSISVPILCRSKKAKLTAPRSDDVYLSLIVKLYRFLLRRTGSVSLKRLFMSRTSRPPIFTKRLVTFMAGKEDKIAVIVATVTDDKRVYDIPALKVTAVRFTEVARARIVRAGGGVLDI